MKPRPTVAVILIGEELLSGKIDDKNGAYAIKRLRAIGADLREIRLIGDEVHVIAPVVRELAAQYDIVFTSGGVGPTHDDLTMEGIAAGFDVPIVTHQGMLDIIENRFGAPGEKLEIWARMAELPEGCEVVISEATRVPIFRMENVWVLPGVPELFRLQFDQVARSIDGRPVTIRTIFITVGEGEIAVHLEAAIALEPTVMLGSYPVMHVDDHRTRITIEAESEAVVDSTFQFLLGRFPAEWVTRVGDSHRINES